MSRDLSHPPPLPALFVTHGSPMLALEPGATGAFFARLGPAIDAAFGRPRAIVVVSFDTAAAQPVARCGYRDYAAVSEMFEALRPTDGGAYVEGQRDR